MAETAVFATEEHLSLLASGLQLLRQSKDLCDVVVVVDGHRFHAHRNVLASISGYFRTMFLGEFAERRQTEITLNDVDAASVKTLIDYAYTGEAQCEIDDIIRLYASAHLLQFDDVVTKCSKVLRMRADVSNCLHLGMFAHRCSDSLLMSVSDRMAAVSIVELADTEEFLALSADHLCRIVALDELGVRDELEVLRVISKWIKHEYESRRKHAKDLLNLVRLPLLDLARFETLLKELQMGELVTERVAEDEEKEGEGATLPRTGCQGVLLVVGGETSEKDRERKGYHYSVSNESRYYDPSQNVWDSFPSLVEPRSRPGLVTVGDVLYAVGGEMINPNIFHHETENREDYACFLNTVERYDSKHNRWVADVAPMSYPRPGNEVTSCLGRIFAISPNPEGNEWFVEAYDSEENRWFPFSSPRNLCKSDVTVAALSDHVYVFYGEGDSFGYIRYNPIDDRWQSYSEAPFSFRGARPRFSVANNDSINFYPRYSFCASFASNSEHWSRFSPPSNLQYSWYDCEGGAADRDNFYILSDSCVTVIDVDSPSKIRERKPDKKYIPEGLERYGAKFISRKFALNLM